MRHLQNHFSVKLYIATSVVLVISVCALLIVKRDCTHNPSYILMSKDYTESSSDYNKYNYEYKDWDVFIPPEGEQYVTSEGGDVFVSPETFYAETDYTPISVSDESIILMSESEAWSLISNGMFDSYPKQSYKSIKSEIEQIQIDNTEVITVKVWYWADPDDDTNFEKVTKTKNFAVNSKIASLFKHIFEDIYNHPSKPIINLADGGMGTWVLRGKNHNSNSTLSAHSIGCAIDINPSTGSFYVNKTWYGNAYGQKSMPQEIWQQLPECHKKYHVLYQDCPIVSIFKSYGFYWGGDWTSGTDSMHLSFLGDGSSARETGQKNYYRYRKQ